MANQEGERARELENPTTRGPLESAAQRYAALAQKFEQALAEAVEFRKTRRGRTSNSLKRGAFTMSCPHCNPPTVVIAGLLLLFAMSSDAQDAPIPTTAATPNANPEHIMLHEFHLGMTEAEWKAADEHYDHPGWHNHDAKPRFSIGAQFPIDCSSKGAMYAGLMASGGQNNPAPKGCSVIPTTPHMTMSTGKFLPKGVVSLIEVDFLPEQFDAVVEAIKTKYAQTECMNKPVQNAMGAQFTETLCKYDTGSETLLFDRFAEGKVVGGRSTLLLMTSAAFSEFGTQKEKAKSDL